ncbi:MAG: hypothetical protein F4137_21570 [Acidobacteria bacterium]|nr:hypothetical protein [Acidobacteriota bacterium]
MSETDKTVEPEEQSAPRERPVPRATWVGAALLFAVGIAVAFFGGFAFRGGGAPEVAEPNEIRTGDAEERAARLAEGSGDPDGGAGASAAETRPAAETGGAAGSVPLDDALAARLAEEQAWLAERARLASDSPLTPAFMETRERIEGWRPKELGPDTGAEAAPASPTAGQAGDGAASPAPDLGPQDGGMSGPTHLLARGSVIPTVLESALDSDLPGLVRAKVAETVFDTLTGAHELIPRGSRLVGTYGSGGRAGQRRLFIAWTDLLLPDGTPVPLGGTGSLGADGASGIKGRRSTGIWTALGAAILFDIAGNASDIVIAAETGEAPGRQGGLAELLGQATGNATSEVGQRYIQEILDRGTRFQVDAGARMNVLVEEDLHLPAQPRGAWR